jgi:hypothetical protein
MKGNASGGRKPPKRHSPLGVLAGSLENGRQIGYAWNVVNDREHSEGTKQPQATHRDNLPEAAKPATGSSNSIPRHQVVGKVRFVGITQERLAEIMRELRECATRTPEELKIANDAWLENEGPGRATP